MPPPCSRQYVNTWLHSMNIPLRISTQCYEEGPKTPTQLMRLLPRQKKLMLVSTSFHSFQSTFVPPKKFNFSSKRINKLKTQAAEFLTLKFELLFTHPNVAVQQPRTKGQPQHTSKWLLPNLFGEKIVTNRVLPLGFNSMETPPNPNM